MDPEARGRRVVAFGTSGINMNGEHESEINLRDIREMLFAKIGEARQQQQQLLILSGAISAFLMPGYFSCSVAPMEHACIGVAIAAFLLAILLGGPTVFKALTTEAEILDDMHKSLEQRDQDAYWRVCKALSAEARRKDHDFTGKTVRALFRLGVLVLITGMILGGFGI